jgi:hypothetical protein
VLAVCTTATSGERPPEQGRWSFGDTHDEILTMVNIALGNVSVTACEAGDANQDGQITVDEILMAVNNPLNGCPKS